MSTHVARHTFADLARKRSGNLYGISRTLGHNKLSTAQEYLRDFDQESVDDVADDMWE